MTTARTILRNTFGLTEFRAQQAEIIDHVAAGKDALVLLPTGQGKSLCYQIPALMRGGTAVVFSPLIALMQDQVQKLEKLGIRAAVLNSLLSRPRAHAVLTCFGRGEFDLLYVAPERLQNPRFAALLDQLAAQGGLSLFAIDEAHCIAQWGRDFRPDYRLLAQLAEKYPDVPRVALTATADELTRQDILATLRMESACVFASGFDRPNICYRLLEKSSPKKQLLEFLNDEHAGHSGMVYCLSRTRVEENAAFLAEHGIKTLSYHAGMSKEKRARNQQRFIEEPGLVMVATNAFGMGIDKPDVRFVVHLDLPGSTEAYYQETGRAGRDDLPADAWMVFDPADVLAQRRLIDASRANDETKRIKSAKLDALIGYCEMASCRRVRLLAYFGQASQPCGNCDNCLEAQPTEDATDEARMVLDFVCRGKGKIGIRDMLADLTRTHSASNAWTMRASLYELKWRRVLRQLVAEGLLRIDLLADTLHLTKSGSSVLVRKSRIHLPRLQERQIPIEHHPAKQNGDIVDPVFLARLQTWCDKVARARRVPAFKILPRTTVEELARGRPRSLAELQQFHGVSKRFIEQFGTSILSVLKA